jgi:hypothetical protein
MLTKYIEVFFILGISLAGNLSFTQPVCAETLVQSTVETRLTVVLRVAQAELQKLVPAPWQVMSLPGGPLKEANFFMIFIDAFLVQDAQGKPDKGGTNRAVVFGAPTKHTQTSEMAFVVTGGFTPNIDNVPGPYKNYAQATIRREQTHKGANLEAGVGEDFWEVRDARGGSIELRVQYQLALPSRAKAEQKIYSAVEPSFFRIYRLEQATDMLKSIPAGINRMQNYQLRVTVPELSKLFDGTEQLVGISTTPLYVRQVFLP